MPRVEPLRREDLPEHEERFALIESAMGFLPSSLLTMARSPQLLEHVTGMVGALERSKRPVPEWLRLLTQEERARRRGLERAVFSQA